MVISHFVFLTVCFLGLAIDRVQSSSASGTGVPTSLTASSVEPHLDPNGVTVDRLPTLIGTWLHCYVEASESHKVQLICNGTAIEFVPEYEFLDEPWSSDWIIDVVVCLTCILVAAIASGLTVGLMGLNKVEVGILTRAGTESEKAQAKRLLPLISRHHLLLCTLLLINATAMEALPIFLDHMVPPAAAIALSVTAVLIFGEIIPQALCTRFGLAIGAFLSPLIWAFITITFPISYPIAKLLDFLIGEDANHLYRRGELKELIALHSEDANRTREHYEEHRGSGDTILAAGEIAIIQSVLDMRAKTVASRMTPMDEVFMLPFDSKLDESTIAAVVRAGHSRIPVHLPNDRNNVVGMLLTKSLIGVPRAPETTISSLELRPMPIVPETKALIDLLKLFQGGRSHMALVMSAEDCVTVRGIVTLEDLVEELLQTEILDEMDVTREERIQKSRDERQAKAVALATAPPPGLVEMFAKHRPGTHSHVPSSAGPAGAPLHPMAPLPSLGVPPSGLFHRPTDGSGDLSRNPSQSA